MNYPAHEHNMEDIPPPGPPPGPPPQANLDMIVGALHEVPKLANHPLVQHGGEVINRLEAISGSIARVEQRMTGMEQRMTGMEQRMGQRIEVMGQRIEVLGQEIANLGMEVRNHWAQEEVRFVSLIL